jgi:hypothetical protein
MMMKTKIIWIAVALIVLVSAAGCDILTLATANEEAPNDPASVMIEFIDAYNDKNESLMIELSTAEMGQIIKDGNFISNGLWGMKYAKLESVSIQVNNEDSIMVTCFWDSTTYEEAEKAGMPFWNFASLVRENGQWKLASGGSTGY